MPFKIYEFKELIRGIRFSRDDIILDIGCGGGLQSRLLAEKCKKVIGVDVSEEAIKAAKRDSGYMTGYMRGTGSAEFRCVKLEEARFENEYFDKIFSICALEHIPNYVEVLTEAYRILKKNGQTIFSVDVLETIEDKRLVERHKKAHFVERYFEKDELKTLLEKIGFKIIEVYPILKSEYAKKLFIKGINDRFRYGYLRSILAYFVLRYKERHCAEDDKGIFLIVKCYK